MLAERIKFLPANQASQPSQRLYSRPRTRYSLETMRTLSPFFIAFLLVLGADCLPNIRPQPEVMTTEPVSGVLGVIEFVDEETKTVGLTLPEGGGEEIVFAETLAVAPSKKGLLARVSGTRDLSTRRITPETFEVIDDQNLVVTSPQPQATVTSPLVVFGFGRAFEQTFEWRVKDEAQKVIAKGFAMTLAKETGWFGPFRFEIFLPTLTSTPFTLELYTISADMGREEDLVLVPLRILSIKTTTFQVFFPNSRMGSTTECRDVFPVARTVAETSAVGRVAMQELLKGPTAAERRQGYFSSLPSGVELLSLVIGNNEAHADFSGELNRVGGACRVISIRAQIEETLRQFPSVGQVTISVEGDTKDALQP